MKTKKNSTLKFEKKAVAELQQEEKVKLQGGKDTLYRNFEKFKDFTIGE